MKCLGALPTGLVVMLASISGVEQSGPTFYVSTTGNDSNSGSFTAPWRTLQHAANSVTAGATVYVEGGVYNESVSFPASGTSALRAGIRVTHVLTADGRVSTIVLN